MDPLGRAPLHYAALQGNQDEVERLLASGADAGQPDSLGWTPLHFAAQGGHLKVAERLLSAGAPVDAQNEHGNTPLFVAVFESRGRGAMITLLRVHGANSQLENRHGISPLELARNIGSHDILQHFAGL